MNKGNDIYKCFGNVQHVYNQVSEMLQYIDESFLKVKGSPKLNPWKGKACSWDHSGAYNMPDKWMNKFFVRYYYTGPKIYPGRAIGICTWLYDVEEGMMLFEVPYVSCSYVEYDRQHKDIDKEWFRRMGQYEGYSLKPDRNKSGIYTYEGSLDDRTEFTKMISYFLELTKLETDEKIDDYVITPLVNLFKGEGTVENIPVKELLILKE